MVWTFKFVFFKTFVLQLFFKHHCFCLFNKTVLFCQEYIFYFEVFLSCIFLFDSVKDLSALYVIFFLTFVTFSARNSF